MGIQKGFDGNRNCELDIEFSHNAEKKPRNRATETILIPKGSILYDVEADNEVRILVHNMMELHDGTTIVQIAVECQREFHQKYFSMKANDWRHLIRDYIRKVTERSNLQEEEIFRYVMTG